jgi:hypothetical protein
MPPVVVALPDCFTRLGGNQYINSASMGAWEDFLLHEMVPAIEQRFGCGSTGPRRVWQELRRVWRHHARAAPLQHLVGRGLSFRRYGLRVVLSPRHAGGPTRTCQCRELDRALVAAARSSQEAFGRLRKGDQRAGDGGQYDSDPTQFLGIRLPVTFDTCEIIEERWANWLGQDPVVAVETQAGNLRRLKALYMDCGEKDQFNLLYGARRFVRGFASLASRIATKSSPTTIAVSITGWTRVCLFSGGR